MAPQAEESAPVAHCAATLATASSLQQAASAASNKSGGNKNKLTGSIQMAPNEQLITGSHSSQITLSQCSGGSSELSSSCSGADAGSAAAKFR